MDRIFMEMAVRNAIRAYEEEEIPVGAVVVMNGNVIGEGYNRVIATRDPTAHAEIIAIGAAALSIDYPYLDSATIYVSCEPCLMCMGAIMQARISEVVYLIPQPKFGYSRFIKVTSPVVRRINVPDLEKKLLKMIRDVFGRE